MIVLGKHSPDRAGRDNPQSAAALRKMRRWNRKAVSGPACFKQARVCTVAQNAPRDGSCIDPTLLSHRAGQRNSIRNRGETLPCFLRRGGLTAPCLWRKSPPATLVGAEVRVALVHAHGRRAGSRWAWKKSWRARQGVQKRGEIFQCPVLLAVAEAVDPVV